MAEMRDMFPGMVNSPVRTFNYVNQKPITVERAIDNKLITVEKRVFTDYILSWGAAILGHNNKFVVSAVEKAVKGGLNFGLNNTYEEALGSLITEGVPSMEMLRFVNSGTEAAMTAIRLARAYTRRDKIIKFSGAYHGHYDSFLVSGGSGLATQSLSISEGLLRDTVSNTIVVEFNDRTAVEKIINDKGSEIAAIIVEPIMANTGVILPVEGYLSFLREITAQNGILLILDEVITGFRFHFGGYQSVVGVTPDLTCLGKIVGGGLPIGVVGGKKEIMQQLAPVGNVYQAGTFSGNPVVCAAGAETLKILKNENIYEYVNRLGAVLNNGLRNFEAGCISSYGAMFSLFFIDRVPKNKRQLANADKEKFAVLYEKLMAADILLPPSPFETAFISAEHSEGDIERLLAVVNACL